MSYYDVKIGGVKADLYRIAIAYGITHPAHFHALKKILRARKGHKSVKQDATEAIESIQRWIEMEDDSK